MFGFKNKRQRETDLLKMPKGFMPKEQQVQRVLFEETLEFFKGTQTLDIMAYFEGMLEGRQMTRHELEQLELLSNRLGRMSHMLRRD